MQEQRNQFATNRLVLLCRCFLVLAASSTAVADPTPIVFGVANRWTIDETATFNSSGMTLDVRRFATIPSNSNGSAARMNAMAFAPGVEGVFVLNAGEFGDATSAGPVYHISPNGTSVTEVLDVADAYTLPRGTSHDRLQAGVRGLAFHPDFKSAGTTGYGKVYTSQLVTRPNDTSGLFYLGSSQSNTARDGLVVEWSATFDSVGNFTGIDSSSAREVFRVAHPTAGHPIKQLAFNNHAKFGDEDYGLLYIAHGDADDTELLGTGQDGTDALGKLLRVNPLDPDGSGAFSYSVPATNPYLGDLSILDEIYALGFRNPHNFSFTKDGQGDTSIFVADIGHGSVEEVNLVHITNRAGQSGNYGWGNREGTFVRDSLTNVNDLPPDDGNLNDFIYPVAQYGHSPTNEAHAIAGGYAIQNGSELDGYYFFGDFTDDRPMMAFSLTDAFGATIVGNPDTLNPAEILTVDVSFDVDNDPLTPSVPFANFLEILRVEDASISRTDVRFGQGPDGEIYLMNKRNGLVYQVSNSLGYAMCDFDKDSDCDIVDLDAIFQVGPISNGIPIIPGSNDDFDLNGNGSIGIDDRNLWFADAASFNGFSAPYQLGDLDLNREIDSSDLGLLLNNFTADTGVYYSAGDIDGSGDVDSTDLGLLLNNFGPAASNAAVPEPSSLGLILLAICGVLLKVRRHR